MESKSFRSQKPNSSNSHAHTHNVRALRDSHQDNSSYANDYCDLDENYYDNDDPNTLHKIDDKGRTTLRYNLLLHDNLPREYFRYFNPEKYVRSYSGLWRKLENMDFASAKSVNAKTAMFIIFYNYMQDYRLDVFLDARVANSLDYSHVVIKAEVSVFRDVLAKVLPNYIFAKICIDPISETCMSFSRALNELWDTDEMLSGFYLEKRIRDTVVLLGFAYLFPVIHAKSFSVIEYALSSIAGLVEDVAKEQYRGLSLPSSSCEKIKSCETDLDMIKTYCIEYNKVNRPERYVDEDDESDEYE